MSKNSQATPKKLPKSFSERLNELIGAIDFLEIALANFDLNHQIIWIKKVAQELRALVIFNPKSKNFQHPLLLDLAKEKKYPLNIYVSKMALHREVEGNKESNLRPTFSWGEAMFSLSRDVMYTQLSLERAIQLPYIILRGKKYSLADIIRLVADTEAAHYDHESPEELIMLKEGQIYGVPTPYMALYEFGGIVQALGKKFINSL